MLNGRDQTKSSIVLFALTFIFISSWGKYIFYLYIYIFIFPQQHSEVFVQSEVTVTSSTWLHIWPIAFQKQGIVPIELFRLCVFQHVSLIYMLLPRVHRYSFLSVLIVGFILTSCLPPSALCSLTKHLWDSVRNGLGAYSSLSRTLLKRVVVELVELHTKLSVCNGQKKKKHGLDPNAGLMNRQTGVGKPNGQTKIGRPEPVWERTKKEGV